MARHLLQVWRDAVRPALEGHLRGEMVGLDQAAQCLERALAMKTELAIGFVGEAQVGKSSLINALVERSALPSGGIGPLTAQATRVCFDETDSLMVEYHGLERLRGVRFALETALVRRGLLPSPNEAGPLSKPEGKPLTFGESDSDPADVPRTPESPTRSASEPVDNGTVAREAQERRFQYILDQLWSMVSGGQTAEAVGRPDPIVLSDTLRAILAEQPRRSEHVIPYREQIERIQKHLGQTERISGSESASFDEDLRLRAAGWLAPLVRDLTVRLRSDLLQGMSFVDLPGIGVQADPGAMVAEQFVLSGGDALVVVMRNSGLTDTVARLLERTRVIQRLLMEGSSPTTIHVVIVVTHLDDVARTRWQDAVKAARSLQQRPPEAKKIFEELSEAMVAKVRSQIRHALLHAPSAEGLTDERRGRLAQRIEHLCQTMDVLCVAAPDYLSIIEGFGDIAFLKDREATHIPALRRRLDAVSERHFEHRATLIREAAHDLHSLADTHLLAISNAYEEGRGAAHAQWETFRADLEKEKARLREDMKASHGEVLAELGSTLPAEIRLLCQEAETGALKKLQSLRKAGEKLHYQSLNAALNRDGVWDQRNINYPEELTNRFVDTIALDWESRIVNGIRGVIGKMAERDLRLVGKLCERAMALDDRIAGEEQIAAQKQMLQQQKRTCIAWTQERLEDLTAAVRMELSKSIGQVMQSACKKALESGQNRGQGAKRQILEAFEHGGTAAAAKAREKALGVLSVHYQALMDELRSGFLAEHHDPVDDAFCRLTDDKLVRAKRSDARRRAAVRAQIAQSMAALRNIRTSGTAAESTAT